jgi:Chromo (CHRromatin Organisation MOdifier) domain
MDFVTHLPETLRGNNAIAAIVCRLSKRRILEPMIASEKGTDAIATAKLVYLNMRRQGVGMIDSFVSDRGPQWDCEFWTHLCRLWKINRKMSTAFHPETDGQTEIVNQETERFIRAFTNYQQDDWDEWLPEGEAAMNSNPSATTGISPFMGTNGYEPQMTFDLQPDPVPLPPKDTKEAKERQRAERFAKEIEKRSEFLRQQITLAQSRMEEAANKSRQPSPNYQPGDYVWLSLKNIKTLRPMKKLDHKNVRCRIAHRIGRDSYKLELPEGMSQLHNVFHTSLLRPDPNDPLPGQHKEPPAPIRVPNEPGEKEGFHDEWNVEEILDSRWRYGHLEYKVKWEGFPIEPRKWYRASLFDHLQQITNQFHGAYPDKPKPRPQGLRITQQELDERVQNRNRTREKALASRRTK